MENYEFVFKKKKPKTVVFFMCLVRLCLPVTCANAKFFFPLELQVTLGLPLKYISSFVPSRRLHAAVCFSFGGCGSSTVFYGAGCWSKHSTGQHWCMEAHLSKAGRDRLLQLHGEHFLFFSVWDLFLFTFMYLCVLIRLLLFDSWLAFSKSGFQK